MTRYTYPDIDTMMADPNLPVGMTVDGTSIRNPWLSECARFSVTPQDHWGMTLLHTGGGCTAWSKIDEDGYEILLTDLDASAPDSPDGGWMMGGYAHGQIDLLHSWIIVVNEDGTVEVEVEE